MSYHLLNIETSEYYFCDDQVWLSAIDIAKENYWDCEGTSFDIMYEADEQCFNSNNEMSYFYAMTIAKDKSSQWDGNYTEKRNQVLSYQDTYYLAMSLEGTGIEAELIEFIKKGSFRICSE